MPRVRAGAPLAGRSNGFARGTMGVSVHSAPESKGAGARRPPRSHPIRVVLGEDDFLAREGITAVLDQLDEIELVGSSSDLDTLRAEIDDHDPDVVVTDI